MLIKRFRILFDIFSSLVSCLIYGSLINSNRNVSLYGEGHIVTEEAREGSKNAKASQRSAN